MVLFKLSILVVCVTVVLSRSTYHDYGDDDDGRIQQRFNLTNEESAEYWNNIGRETVKRHKERIINDNVAKNVILFLGDGMSIATISAARAYLGQMDGNPGEESNLSFEEFPAVGLSKTYCVNRQVADSACTATAYLCGIKNNYNTIGLTAKVPRSSCELMKDPQYHVDSILKKAIDNGLNAGIVTTTRVTHASPAGAYAHTAHREWESDSYITSLGHDITECRDIAHQLVHNDPGNKFKVILGGGRREFYPNTTVDEERYRGLRTDGRNLIAEWRTSKQNEGKSYEYVWTKPQLLQVSDDTEYLLGLFEGSHCQYHLTADPAMEPTFEEMVEAAIKILSKDGKGYILFAEGGNIDHGHHSTRAQLALDETVEFAKGIGRAVEMTNSDDTLIVVTSDHSHVMTYSGYPTRGNPVLGPNDRNIGSDGIQYMTLSYANGPGYRAEVNGSRVDVTKEDISQSSFRSPAMVPLSSETHSGEDVAVYAFGPQQHLFTGAYEQNAIPHMISYAACFDDDFSACNDKK